MQELTVPSYVANDTKIASGPGRSTDNNATRDSLAQEANLPAMLIMTGPNYSGKSVFLKQTALIVYMAHVGCFVPAEKAVIGLTDRILTRIRSRETVSKMQSAFMIDLQQIALALRMVTFRSLLVIDEFGKGTDSNGMSF